MANPNNLDDIFDVTVDISEAGSNATSFSDPLLVATFTATPSFPTRVKEYTGNASTIKASLVADGFATTSPAYLMASRVVDQKGATRRIYIGRRDAGDADLVAALTAILAEEDGWYHAFADPDATTNSEHNGASAWMELQFGMYHVQTNSAAILNNSPGNLAATVLAAQRRRTVIVYHDAELASGYGPAILRSDRGPFALPNGATLELRIDGGTTQVFTFTSAAATVTSSNTETYAVTDGDDMVLVVDSGSTQTLTVDLSQATVVSVNAEPYDVPNGANLLVRRNGAAATNVVFNGTAGSVETDPDTFNLTDGWTVTFAIDGGANQVVTFATADFVAIAAATAEEVAAVYTAALTGVDVTNDGSTVVVTSQRLGTSSNVRIVAGTAGALTELGYTVGNNAGTGFAAFLDVATAAEVAAEIDNDTTNVITADASGYVSVASNTEGTSSRIQIAGGSANLVLGFETSEYSGAGDFADGATVTAAEAATWINNNSFGLTATAPATAVVLTSDTKGSASSIQRVSGSLLTTFGFTVATSSGSGFAANSAAAEVSEVATLIDATIADAAASSASNRVVITSTSQGELDASVEAVGGTALAVLFSGSDYAAGTGVAQDYLGAAWIGYGSSIQLDRPRGNAAWDNAGNLVGVYADPGLKAYREVLQETLRVNTYEPRQPSRDEFHDGLICRSVNSLHRYIDQQISADWLDARLTEALKAAKDAATDARTQIPMSDEGLQQLGGVIIDVLNTANINGHTFFDDSTIDANTPNDTGVTIPKLSDLTESEIDARRASGFRVVQRLQNGIQGAIVPINLVNVLAG